MTVSATVDLTDVDLFVCGEHHAALRWLRDHDPVYWNPAGRDGFWAITRHVDVLDLYRRHRTFGSSRGAILGGSFRRDAQDTAAGRMVVASDPPRHRMLRHVLHPMFGPAVIERVVRRVETVLDAAFRRLIADGGGDFAADVAPELPAGALMALFNIGHGDAHELIRLTRAMIGYRDNAYGDPRVEPEVRLARVQTEIMAFFADLLPQRRARPGDDLVSLLCRAEVNGRAMTEADILYNCLNVAVGGNETASHSACGGLIALMDHPAQYRRLLDDPGLLGTAVDEILRWSSTNAYVRRVAMRDTVLHDRTIRAGDSVTLWNVSANRDERAFERPDVFDIARSPNHHVSYGSGIHRCIGAPGGSAELTALFGRLARERIRLVRAGPVHRLRSNFILGVTSLPVAVEEQ